MDIGAVVALVGAVGAFALVRQSDFIVPTGPAHGDQAGAAANRGAAAPVEAGIPAAHA
jgi:hypothetical protein